LGISSTENIKGVSISLFNTLYLKYIEAKKANGIISDEKLCEIFNKIDYDFSKFNTNRYNILYLSLRTKYFDGIVERFIEGNNKPIVVTLGCGLDTRRYRIPNNNKAIFVDVDLPEVISLRRRLLPPKCNDIYIPVSVTDCNWISALYKYNNSHSFIFIAEGLLMYLEEADVRQIMLNIASIFKNSKLHFDVCSKRYSKRFNYYDSELKYNVVFKWGIDDDKEIEQWSPNLKHVFTEFLFQIDTTHLRYFSVLLKMIPKRYIRYRILSYEIL
jgi:methyltransferase (TIGR00027 family)